MRATSRNHEPRKEPLQVRLPVLILERLYGYAALKDRRPRDVVAETLDQALPSQADIERLQTKRAELAQQLGDLQQSSPVR